MSKKSVTTFADKWDDVLSDINSFLNDDSQSFGEQASIAEDLIKSGLEFLARTNLLDEARVKISGETNDHQMQTTSFQLERQSSHFRDDPKSWIKYESCLTSLEPGDDDDDDDDDLNDDCDEQ